MVAVSGLFLWHRAEHRQPAQCLGLAPATRQCGRPSHGKRRLLPLQQAALMGQWIWNQVAYRSSRFRALLIGGCLWITLWLVATMLPGLHGALSP